MSGERDGKTDALQSVSRKLLRTIEIWVILIVVITQVYIGVKMDQIAQFRCVHFIVLQLFLNEIVLKIRGGNKNLTYWQRQQVAHGFYFHPYGGPDNLSSHCKIFYRHDGYIINILLSIY